MMDSCALKLVTGSFHCCVLQYKGTSIIQPNAVIVFAPCTVYTISSVSAVGVQADRWPRTRTCCLLLYLIRPE